MKRSLFLRLSLAFVLAAAFGCSQGGGGGEGGYYPAPKNTKPGAGVIVTYGDSLTAGVKGETPYSEFLRKKFGNVMNTAVAGMNSQQAVEKFETLVLQFNPKLVIITIGGNDALQEPRVSKRQSIANLEKMIAMAQEKGALVLYLGIQPPVKEIFPQLKDVPDDKVEAAYEVSRFAEMVHAARLAGALAVDDCMAGIWLNQELKIDELHPNTAGGTVIGERVLKALGTMYP